MASGCFQYGPPKSAVVLARPDDQGAFPELQSCGSQRLRARPLYFAIELSSQTKEEATKAYSRNEPGNVLANRL